MKQGILLLGSLVLAIATLTHMIQKEKEDYLEKIRTGQIEVQCDDTGLANQEIENVIFTETGPVFKLKGRQDYISCEVYTD